jgi:hypothetical protein
VELAEIPWTICEYLCDFNILTRNNQNIRY